jgi:hypothetical protein
MTIVKNHNFNTTEVIKAESREVVNTLTEHKFQHAFKKWQTRWVQCIHADRDYFKGDGGQ